MARWDEFAADAPVLAAAVRDRFEANLHHVIGTIRPDGTPRLSGSEVTFGGGEVSIGMMAASRKLADVERDPRVEIHSAPIEDDLAGGDAKLAGRLRRTGTVGDDEGYTYALDMDRASLVRVDGDELDIAVWTPARGARTMRRT